MLKYSLDAVVNNPVFFAGIYCGVRYRKELCAMEMVNFDISATVYDYFTAEKIGIGKAYFWLDGKNKDAPILAFRLKETAEKYGADLKPQWCQHIYLCPAPDYFRGFSLIKLLAKVLKRSGNCFVFFAAFHYCPLQ